MKEDKSISRRRFLKTAAAIGAALTITPTLNKVQAAEAVLTGKNGSVVKKTEGDIVHSAQAKPLWKFLHLDSVAWA